MEPRVWHAHYDPAVPAQVDFEDLSVAQLLERSAERFPDRTALIFGNARMNYARLLDQVRRLSAALAGLGVARDSRVAIHMPNLPQTVIAYYAVLSCGAQAVMTNPMYVGREIEHQWNDAGCEVAITADFLYARVLADIRHELPVRQVIIASIPEYLRFPLKQMAPFKLRKQNPPTIARVPAGPDIHRFRALVDATPPAPKAVDIEPSALAVLQYTGGTTGVSKAAMLSHRNLVSNVQQCNAWMPMLDDGREVLLAALPYFHIFGMTISLNQPVSLGATIVLAPNPRDTGRLLKAIVKHRVTVFPAVPAMLSAFVSHPGVEDMDVSSVKAVFSGSAPLPEDTRRRFEARTGARVFEGFGLTETSPATHANPIRGQRKTGTVGLPLPDTEARIVDLETGQVDQPAGAEGELVLRGPQVMQGYWKRPDETAETLRNGWLFTGDLAVMDDEGYFRIVGRKKDMILASGYNIFPDEIDHVLTDHPGVAEACTIGVPDERRGETVKSFVVLEPGAQVTVDDLEAHCRGELAAYKVPRSFEFRADLPKSAMLKLLRRELRDEVLARSGRDA
jgi:long-chain acyl-CoA synthetase